MNEVMAERALFHPNSGEMDEMSPPVDLHKRAHTLFRGALFTSKAGLKVEGRVAFIFSKFSCVGDIYSASVGC